MSFLPEGDRHTWFRLRLIPSGLAAYGVCALNDRVLVPYLASMPALSVFLQYFVAFLMVVLVILLNLPVRPGSAPGLFLLEYGSLLSAIPWSRASVSSLAPG